MTTFHFLYWNYLEEGSYITLFNEQHLIWHSPRVRVDLENVTVKQLGQNLFAKENKSFFEDDFLT